MLVVMKILHLFGLMIGAAGGMGGMMVAIQARRAEGPPAAELSALRPRFAAMTLAGVTLLWLTGLWLWITHYDGALLGAAFLIKLALAAFLLAVAVAAYSTARRAMPGTPPPALLQRLGPLAGLSSFLAVVFAVYIFR